MRRFLAALFAIAMLLSAVSCGGNNTSGGENTDEGGSGEEFADMKVNGVSIEEYTIVCDADGLDYNTRAAEYVRDAIKKLTGVEVKIADDSEPMAEREIVVGETAREISAELNIPLSGVQFSFGAKDGSVALEGNFFSIAAAAYYFVDTYVKAGDIEISDGSSAHEPITKTAKNYILLIGDGMGVNQTMLHSYLEDTCDYSDGEDLFFGYMLPYLGFSRTKSYSGITDSAAGGTALATGYKTINGYVGLDKDGNEIKSLTELASELGKATAVMSTETNTGATPASFSAHADSRNSSKEIMDDQDVTTETYGTIINCRDFAQYSARYMKNNEKRIVETLNKLNADNDGFFMMYEEAHIDKHCHNNDIDNTFLALLSFNQAIGRFMEFAFYNPETVVIITADHETGMLLENEDGTLSYNSGDHSDANVPVFAWGFGAEHFDEKEVENIEIAHFLASSMGVDDFGDKTGGWYDEIYGEDNH